jgi:hypothetical protein
VSGVLGHSGSGVVIMRTFVLISVGFVVAVLLVLGCPKKQDSPAPLQPPAPPGPVLADLPIEMTVKQRTTTAVPGADGALSVTIDDITRGQAMISLAGRDGVVVLGPTSLAEGRSAVFKLADTSYSVTLKELDNELVGDDSATLLFSKRLPSDESSRSDSAREGANGDDAVSERDKIEKLIEHVGSLEGAVFIRNGEEYTPAEAAEHLRRKWESAGGEIATADDFIEKLASKSSVSGEEYKLRLKGGTELSSGEYLRKRLAEIERTE